MIRLAAPPNSILALLLLFLAIAASPSFAQEEAGEVQGEDVEEEAPLEPDSPELDFKVDTAPSDVDEILVMGATSGVTDVSDEAAAITAFGMEELDEANISNVEGLAYSVPSLHVGVQGNQVIVTLRGIGTQNASPNGEPGVAMMLDGVNYIRPVSAQVAFFDLEGLQVQKGPQGTKGGKNANAGWIDVTTRKPHSDFEFTGDVQIGSYNQRRTRFALNLPVNEFFQTRTAMIYSNRDGFLENQFFNSDDRDHFDTDDFGFRQHFQFQPTDTLETLLTYNYYRQNGNGVQTKLIPKLTAERTDCNDGALTRLPRGPACPGVTNVRDRVFPGPDTMLGTGDDIVIPNQPDGSFSRFPASDALLDQPNRIQTNDQSERDNRFWGFTSTTTWQAPELPWLGETELKGIGAFQRVDNRFVLDFDSTNQPLSTLEVPEETKQSSGEFQWSSVGGELFDWQLSGFYLRQQTDQKFTILSFQEFNPDSGEMFFNDFKGVQDTTNLSQGLALHTDWYPLEDLTVSAGARYTKDTKEILVLREATGLDISGLELEHCEGGASDFNNDFEPDGPFDASIPGFTSASIPSCERTFRDWSGGLNLQWRPLDEHLFYARADRGFKSGGFANFGFGEYTPEYIWAYALGAKSSFFDDRVNLSIEGFYYDYTDLQIVNIDGVTFRTENADATLTGIDFELEAELISGLNFKAGLGYLATEVDDFCSIDPTDIERSLDKARFDLDPINFSKPDCVDYGGNKLSRSPKLSLDLGVDYTFYIGDYGSVTPRVKYYWQDDTFYRIYNEPLDLQEDYHRTDFGLTWRSPQEKWTVDAFVNNLEDSSIFQNVLIGPRTQNSPQNAYYGAPRIWGLRVGLTY